MTQAMEAPTRPEFNFQKGIDREGCIVYFGLKDRKLLFNGHSGTFYDALPEWASDVLDSAAGISSKNSNSSDRIRNPRHPHIRRWLQEISRFQKGTHPELVPEKRQADFRSHQFPSSIQVYVSQGCNLNCNYCFSQKGTFGRSPSLMSLDTARNALSFIIDAARQEKHRFIGVNLFGGEPLLAPRAVRLIARGLQDFNHERANTKIRVMLSTNGTLYSEEIFSIFAERADLCTVVVSLDAFKGIHDKNRPFADKKKKSSYDAVIKNLRRMEKNRIPFSIVCVVPYPYDYIGASAELRRRGFSRFEIKPLIRHVYGKSRLPKIFQTDFEMWRSRYLAYVDYYVDYLHENRPAAHIDRHAIVRDYAKALTSESAFYRVLACGVADEKIAITPDGTLLPCESFLGHGEFTLGDVHRGFDPARYRRFRDWLLLNGQHRVDQMKCRYCFAKRICGGGCYALSYDKTGSLRPLNSASCRYMREMVKIDLYFISRIREEHPDIFAKITGS